MILARLAISNFRARKVRTALTSLAIIASVSLVVAVTSGYATMRAAAYRYLTRYMGSTDVTIQRRDEGVRGGIDNALLKAVESDPQVRSVTPRLVLITSLPDLRDHARDESSATQPAVSETQVIGIRLPDDAQVVNQKMDAGAWFDGDAGNVAVIDQVAAAKMKVKVGDRFDLPGRHGKLNLQVIGIVHKPSFLAAHIQTVYLPLRTMQHFAFPEDPEQFSRLRIDLQSDVDAAAFAARWRDKLKSIDPMLALRVADENKQAMEKNFIGIRILSLMGGTVSMLAAAFIVFSALSMGVSERQRSLAMLRAIGAFRAQLGWLVILEALLLAVFGVALGVPLGWLWVKILFSLHLFRDIVGGQIVLDWVGVAYGSLGSIAAAVIASAIPAWMATRADPLEAMTPLATPLSRRVPALCAIGGIALISIDPLLMTVPFGRMLGLGDPITRAIQLYGHFLLGLPGLMIGFFLLAPLFVMGVERLLSPIVAPMFRLRHALLRQQLSSGVWRSAGTAAALMVGLAVLIAMNTQGNSAIQAWKLPDHFPDVFIIVRGGVARDDIAKLSHVEGIKPDEVMPIAIASPRLGTNFMAIAGAAVMPEATMFFGVDPDKLTKMIELDFRQGSAEQAAEMLKKGRHLIVTDEYRKLKGLGVGDKLALQTPMSGTVEYTIAGVVWSPGMDVMASRFDLGRQLDQRTAASVFGSMEDARRDFGATDIILFAANLDYFTEKEQVVERLKEALDTPAIDIADVRQIKHDIQQGLHRLLLLASTVAYAAMAVASLGVANTIMASIRSRQWQFGILRAVGLTRGQLLRLVVAEAMLLGFVGAALGLSAGLLGSLTANRLAANIVGFEMKMRVPWDVVAIGAGVVMLISLLASLWPATHAARSQPLSLLQAGRAAS